MTRSWSLASWALVAIALVAFSQGCGGSARHAPARVVHEDGDGPLSARSEGGGSSLYAPDASRWKGGFGGLDLCTTKPDADVVVQSVRVATDVEPRSVSWLVRTVAPGPASKDGDNRPFLSFLGSPPDFREPYVDPVVPRGTWSPVAGTRVTRTCSALHQDGAAGGFQELELVLGAGPEGARVTDSYVDYLSNGKPYELHIATHYALCGADVRLTDCHQDAS